MEIEVRNSPQLKKLIASNPEGAQSAVIEWQSLVEENSDLHGIRSYEEWLNWVGQHPGTDKTLWVGREIQVVSQDKNNQTNSSTASTQSISLPGSEFFGKVIEGYAFVGIPLIEHDWDYAKLSHNLQQEWLKANGKKDFSSKEGLDYLYGSLDGTTPSLLHEEAEKQLRKKAETNKKLARRLAEYDEEKKKAYPDITYDPAVMHLKKEIAAHAEARYALVLKTDPKANREDIDKQVADIAWENFVTRHPEKVKEYSSDTYKKTNSDITSALERVKKKSTAPKGAFLMESMRKAYEERFLQKGLADLPKPPASNLTSSVGTRKIVGPRSPVSNAEDVLNLAQALEDNDAAQEEMEQAMQDEQRQEENDDEQQQAQQRQPREPKERAPQQRAPKKPGLGGLRNGLKGLRSAGTAARAGAMAARAGVMAIFANPITLFILGIVLIIIIVVVIFVLIISNDTTPTNPSPYIPGPGGGEIAQCQFTRAGKKYFVKSSKLQQYMVQAAAESGIPSSIIASIAMHETLDFVANADDNHDSIVSGNYCVKGPPFCEFKGKAISENACTPAQIASGARTGTATGLMQNVDIFNPGVDLCSIKESLTLATKKLKRDGLISRPEKAEVIEAVRRYYNSCTYGGHNYCEDVWSDYQSCLVSTTPPRPSTTIPGQRPTAPVSTNLAEDIRTQFGITMEGFSQQHLQWTWEKFWEISNTKFNSLVRNTKVISSNDSAQLNNFLITIVAYNDEKLFKAVLIHEFGHIIRWRTDAKLNEVKQAINAEGYLTTYSSNQGGCAVRRQFDEDYAEMIAYYLNPETPSRTSRCSSGPNPFANGANPLHYNIAREILGDF